MRIGQIRPPRALQILSVDETKKDIKYSRTTVAFRKNKTAPKLLTGAVIEYARNVCKPPA